jgi:NSS family neurotransmitter:Na+ symporter
MLLEMSLGRMSQSTPLVAFKKLSGTRYHNIIGWVEVGATVLILGFYLMILAWITIYFVDCITGKITHLPVSFDQHFDDVATSFTTVFSTALALLALSAYIILRGFEAWS